MNISQQIPQAPVPAGYRFRDVQLEMSLKPFWDNTPETCEAVCREIFLQWLPLCRYAESISIMLWIGDGSEVLEYTGDPGMEFEWGRYLGSANPIHADPVPDKGDPTHTAINGHIFGRDPEKRGVHLRSYLYRSEPARFTFRWLAGLIATLKRVGAEITGKRINVGETFDIGPEFAISRFKYDWHREVCGGGKLFGGKFIRCDALLNGDERPYAGFPRGIPDKTSFGTFLGRQARHFFADCPFDFLWFSNGFGFALEPWALTGAIFDGKDFHTGTVNETTGQIMRFWHDFRAEMPDLHIRTRGTNLATGIDLGSDASPWREIYRDVPHIDAPVNSPWAALDGDIGLELAGWMSHMARLPDGGGIRYRYYIHDAWWLNSPYLDRYQRQPFDIYLPLAVSRLRADGSVETPRDLAFLSIDDTQGRMPVVVPTEVTPYILHAREFMPDAPAPLVWVYPWDAYHDLLQGAAKNPGLPFFGDWFVRGLITHAVPLNSVADFADIEKLLEGNALAGSILVAPVLPDGFGVVEKALAFAEAGGGVLMYGPLVESGLLREALETDCAEPLDGDFETDFAGIGKDGRTIRHISVLSAGGWAETHGKYTVAAANQGGASRAACAFREFPSGGKIGWIRGSLATSEYEPERQNKILGPRLTKLPADRFLATEKFARTLLARMGLAVNVGKEPVSDSDPMFCIHRHRNAYVFSGYQPDATTSLQLGFDLGAPLFIGMQNAVATNATMYSGPRSWHHVCRVFVEQSAASRIECRIIPPVQHGYTLRLLVSGARDATLHFFPEPGTEERLEILRDPMFPYFVGEFDTPRVMRDSRGVHVTVEHVNGEILFSW